MKYTMEEDGIDGCYAMLLTDAYGGVEIFGEEWEILSKLFETDKPEEITLTTDEDVEDHVSYDRFRELVKQIEGSPVLKSEIDYPLYDFNGVHIVVYHEGLVTLFLKVVDKEKFNELTGF